MNDLHTVLISRKLSSTKGGICRCSGYKFRIARHSGAMYGVNRFAFLESHDQTQVIRWTQEITVGSWTFQPLIQSQRVKSTSPKAVMRVKSKLVFGRM
jgi:hypothetical protein